MIIAYIALALVWVILGITLGISEVRKQHDIHYGDLLMLICFGLLGPIVLLVLFDSKVVLIKKKKYKSNKKAGRRLYEL